MVFLRNSHTRTSLYPGLPYEPNRLQILPSICVFKMFRELSVSPILEQVRGHTANSPFYGEVDNVKKPLLRLFLKKSGVLVWDEQSDAHDVEVNG